MFCRLLHTLDVIRDSSMVYRYQGHTLRSQHHNLGLEGGAHGGVEAIVRPMGSWISMTARERRMFSKNSRPKMLWEE